MGVGDKLLLLRDGTVNLTGTEPGLPATAGTFVIDTATGIQVPSTGVVFETARTGPGLGFDHGMWAAVIVPGSPVGTQPTTTGNIFKIQVSDGYDSSSVFQPTLSTAVWEDLFTFGSELNAGGLTSAPLPETVNLITLIGTYRGLIHTTRRFIRHNVTTFNGSAWGGVVIRLEEGR